MCPSSDDPPAEKRPSKPLSDRASLQQLNDAFAEMLNSDVEAKPDEESTAEATEESTETKESNAGPSDVSQAPSPTDPLPKRIVEAMLFVGHPENSSLKKDQIARAIHGLQPEEVDDLIAELCSEYTLAKSSYDILYDDGGYRMVLRPEFEKIRERFYGPIREAKLSQAAVEVLALVAYNQPTTSEKISQLRGHPSGPILSQLVRRQLLRFEKPEKKPRTPVYRTTPRFLKLFGLSSLEELPENQELNS